MNILFFLKPKSEVAYVTGNSTIRQGIEKLKAHRQTAIPVLDEDGSYVGTVNEGDFLRYIVENNQFNLKDEEHKYIRDIIRLDWNPSVKIDITMDELFKRITNQNFVPVVDDRNLFVGIITRKDVIEYFYKREMALND